MAFTHDGELHPFEVEIVGGPERTGIVAAQTVIDFCARRRSGSLSPQELELAKEMGFNKPSVCTQRLDAQWTGFNPGEIFCIVGLLSSCAHAYIDLGNTPDVEFLPPNKISEEQY